MISNGTIPNDGCSTDGPSSPKGTVPWVQLFGSTSHLFLTTWCPSDVLLSVDTLEEHLAIFFYSLEEIRGMHKSWGCFWSTRQSYISCKAFPCNERFQDYIFPGLSCTHNQHPRSMDLLSYPDGSSWFVHLAYRVISQNLFFCCKVSLGKLCLTVQVLLQHPQSGPGEGLVGSHQKPCHWNIWAKENLLEVVGAFLEGSLGI